MELMDEVQKKSMWIVIEMIDFEILEAQIEIEIFEKNNKK